MVICICYYQDIFTLVYEICLFPFSPLLNEQCSWCKQSTQNKGTQSGATIIWISQFKTFILGPSISWKIGGWGPDYVHIRDAKIYFTFLVQTDNFLAFTRKFVVIPIITWLNKEWRPLVPGYHILGHPSSCFGSWFRDCLTSYSCQIGTWLSYKRGQVILKMYSTVLVSFFLALARWNGGIFCISWL